VVRAAILEGYTAGRHPNSIAVEIAGRMQGGKRVGGLVGLSGPHGATMSHPCARGWQAATLPKWLRCSG
jgi:hypothetical protein